MLTEHQNSSYCGHTVQCHISTRALGLNSVRNPDACFRFFSVCSAREEFMIVKSPNEMAMLPLWIDLKRHHR
jgi:hypothetical protein